MTLAEGLAQSINTIAVQVAQRAGIRNVVAVARRLGISSPLAPGDPSLALGTDEVNLIELVSAYAPFANGGNGVWPLRHRRNPRQQRQGRVPPLRIRSRTGGIAAISRHDERDAERA